MGRNAVVALLFMAAFFIGLWAPLGQQAFLAEHWMKIGTFAAPMLLFMAFSHRAAEAGPWLDDVKLVATLLAAAYMIHQFEEHWVDLFGRLYPLKEFLNDTLSAAFGEEARGAMTPEAIFFINTSVVWMIAFIAIWRAPDHVFPSLTIAGVIFVNGVAHVGMAIGQAAYNPGLATGLLLFLPLSVLFYRAMLRGARASWTQILLGVGWGLMAHVILVAGLLLANVQGIIPVEIYYAALILWAILPALLFRPARS